MFIVAVVGKIMAADYSLKRYFWHVHMF